MERTGGYDRYLAALLAALVAITAYRTGVALSHGLTLYVDEAQYWLWAQNLDWGYFSKPPMIALAIWLPTQICGVSEPCIRAAPLIVYPVSTLLVYATAKHLYDDRTALIAGLAFVTMPGVSLSTLIISTDVLLFLFWALALYAFARAIDSGSLAHWVLVGAAGGLGLQTKYSMGIFAVCALSYLLLDAEHRRLLRTPGPYVGAGVAGLLFLPNILWNVLNDFPTVRHTAHISNLENTALYWGELGEFLAGQFLVFGPVLFALFLWTLLARGFAPQGRPARLLYCFSVPFLAIIALQAVFGRANANWAAPTYVAAAILVSAWLVGARGRSRPVVAIIAISVNIVMGLAMYHFERLYDIAGVELSARTDGLKRYRGWNRFAAEVAPILDRYPDATLLGDERDVLSQLIYYVRPHPMDAVIWNSDSSVRTHFHLTTTMDDKVGRDFVLVTDRDNVSTLAQRFEDVTLLKEVDVEVHSDWHLRAKIYLLRSFRGY